MDAVTSILDWLSHNSRNLTEAQKREIQQVLESLKNQLETRTGMGPSSRDHQHQFSQKMAGTRDRNEKKFHEMSHKVDSKHASLESKIQQVTNIISKETGYMNGKIDTIAKEYNNQLKMLRNKVRDLEKEKMQKEREKTKVSDRDIDHLTANLKSLMKSIVPEPCPSPYPPNFNPPHPPPHDRPPPYHPYPPMPPMIPPQNIPYFPHYVASPQGGIDSVVSEPLSFQFPNHFGPNLSKPPPCDKNEKVYRFSGNSGSGPSGRADSNAAAGSGQQKFRFDRPSAAGVNDGKADGNPRKNYCDSYWKNKTDIRHQQRGSKNESSSGANMKFHHKGPSRNEQFGADSSKFCGTSQFKNYADRGKNKRFQQFGKNRPQNHDDGGDSDTSTASHAASKDTRKKCPVGDFKFAKNKNLQSTPPDKIPNFQNRPKNSGDGGKRDTSTATHGFPKNFRKEPAFKTKIEDPRTSTTTTNKNPQSTEKSSTSELEKLQYPSRADALKRGIDIRKHFESLTTCLGKVNGVPFSRPANCLEDIYNFEREFGPCQVIRY